MAGGGAGAGETPLVGSAPDAQASALGLPYGQPQPPKRLSPSWNTTNHGGVQRGVSFTLKLNAIPLKVYFFLPDARSVPVKRWSCTSCFGQWSPDLSKRTPVHSAPSLIATRLHALSDAFH